MAPIKFEENIKEKLEKRTLTPSSDAWSSLTNRLDKYEERRSRKPIFWWFGIAASIALIIFISSEVLKDIDQIHDSKPILVKEDLKTKQKKGEHKEDILLPQIDETVVKTQIANQSTEELSNENEAVLMKKVLKKTLKGNKGLVDRTMQRDSESLDKSSKKLLNLPSLKTIQDIEVAKVVEEINKIKAGNNNSVTDREIDSLLKIANKELLNERVFKNATNVVDADALLRDIEDDLGESFRSKVYEALKGGYNKVKTAVAERNN